MNRHFSDTLVEDIELDEAKKKKNQGIYSSISYTTGCPKYNMDMFNKLNGTDTSGALSGTIDGHASTQAMSADTGSGDAGAGDAGASAGGMGEALEKQDIDFLVKDEEEAIRGYEKKIEKADSDAEKEVLSHIKDEEEEHIDELNNLADIEKKAEEEKAALVESHIDPADYWDEPWELAKIPDSVYTRDGLDKADWVKRAWRDYYARKNRTKTPEQLFDNPIALSKLPDEAFTKAGLDKKEYVSKAWKKYHERKAEETEWKKQELAKKAAYEHEYPELHLFDLLLDAGSDVGWRHDTMAAHSGKEAEYLHNERRRNEQKANGYSGWSVESGEAKDLGTLDTQNLPQEKIDAYKKEYQELSGKNESLTEAKRYVRRYYIRPQNIFCSNKAEIIKALIDIGGDNCTIYTLNNLGDEKDVTKLTNDDVIYYYDDEILYDKNHLKVMDYDLAIKHEEERDKINVNTVSDATMRDVYYDRMTDVTELEESASLTENAHYCDSYKGYDIYREEDGAHAGEYWCQRGYTDQCWDAFFATKQELKNYIDKYSSDYDNDEFNESASLNESKSDGIITGKQLMPYVFANKAADGSIKAGPKQATKDTEFKELASTLYHNKAKRIETANLAKEFIKEFLDTPRKDRAIKVELELALANFLNKHWPNAVENARYQKTSTYTKVISTDRLLAVQCSAYAEAIIKVFFEQIIADIKTKMKSGENRALDMTADEQEVCKAWLKEHVTGIKFYIPQWDLTIDNDDISLCPPQFRDTDKQEAQIQTTKTSWESAEAAFKNRFPEAKQNVDFEYRLASKSADDRKDMWHISAKTMLDCTVGEAPEEVKNMIDDAKRISKAEDVKYSNEMADDNHVDSYPFAKAVVKLFNDKLHFYKESLDSKAFDLMFEDIDATGKKLTEEDRTFTCCICGEEEKGYGNNPEPFKHEGRCCDACNIKFVIPARLAALKSDEE